MFTYKSHISIYVREKSNFLIGIMPLSMKVRKKSSINSAPCIRNNYFWSWGCSSLCITTLRPRGPGHSSALPKLGGKTQAHSPKTLITVISKGFVLTLFCLVKVLTDVLIPATMQEMPERYV